MLSKSAARAFFLGGTAVCVLAFLGLTYDTFTQIPSQTNADQITPAVARGKHLWDTNNCMGCHTIFGEGAYYAPELTNVLDRRGETFVRSMLRDPEAMYPGQRRMVQYDFTDAEIDDLVAFFGWIGRVDTNGFPADPPLAGQIAASPGLDDRPLVFVQTCTACHALDGRGGNIGPALDGIGDRLDHEYLGRWLRDPEAVRPGTTMPQLNLSDAQVEELVAYLSELNEGN